MSNVEARASTLSPAGGKPVGVGDESRRGRFPEIGTKRRWLFSAILFSGDIVSGAMAVVAAAVMVAVAAGQMNMVGRMPAQMCLLLLLLLGINCSLGLYRSNIRSQMERFHLRATATLLFVFAGMLMWIREGPLVELAIIPVVAAIAFVVGLWIEHLIGAHLVRSGIYHAPTAILGVGASSRALARLLLSHPSCRLRPIGFIDDGPCSDDVADEFVQRDVADAISAACPCSVSLTGGVPRAARK
jgi:FlaA1/EpsC-like NDP-sugar epimerase